MELIEQLLAGPWEAGTNPKANSSEAGGIVVRPKGEFPHGLWIADCGRIIEPERMRIAKLIAAAPTMREALTRLSNEMAKANPDLSVIRMLIGEGLRSIE